MDISQFELENLLSIRVFKSHGDILGYRCFAWNTLIDHLWKIMPVGMYTPFTSVPENPLD